MTVYVLVNNGMVEHKEIKQVEQIIETDIDIRIVKYDQTYVPFKRDVIIQIQRDIITNR